MSAEQVLRAMCARHGLPESTGKRLLPIVRRALQSPEEVRERLLRLVERSLAERGADPPGALRADQDADGAVLVAVARVLHDWDPSSVVLDLGSRLEQLSREPDDAEREG